MCGICGFVGFEDKALIKSMSRAIHHRGPDESGVFVDKNICMAIRRLSIIDLEGGSQPIHNEDGSICVVYNGEIYNYIKIKKYLEDNGHKFYTKCDTEVLVHLYEEYGDVFPRLLEGMFAFALWDKKQNKLLLGRDRFGKKPLYYCMVDDKLYFASEIKCMLIDSDVPRKVDISAASGFMSFRAPIGEDTMFIDINKLLPAHIMIFKNGCLTKKRYWNMNMIPEKNNESYFLNKLELLLTDAVRKRFMSEVPLGAYLSGGIDSSTIVAIMSKLSEEPVKTFSIGFQSEFDETEHARTIAELFNTDHREFTVKKKSIKIMPEIIWHMDEPVADPTCIPTYFLSEQARKHVTVVLTGEGGDEIFGGYFQYNIMSMLQNNYIPKTVFKIFKKMPKFILNKTFQYTESLGKKGMERFDSVINSHNTKDRFLNIVSLFDENEKRMLGIKPKKYTEYSLLCRNAGLNNLLLFDMKTEMVNDLLMKVDKMTMAHSIEARAPYMDHKLAEFSATIPEKLKVNGMKSKIILRKLAARYIPKYLSKRKKQNFFVPIHDWKDDIVGVVQDMYSDRTIGQYFNKEYINEIIRNYDSSKLYFGRQLWCLLTFGVWFNVFIQPTKIKPNMKLKKLF